MIDSTFVTFGKAIARAQVRVMKTAVRMKFLKLELHTIKILRLLVVVGLSENKNEKLVAEGVVVAREGRKNDETEGTSCDQHSVVRIEVRQGSTSDDNARACIEGAPVPGRRNRCVENEVNGKTACNDHFDPAVARPN